MSKILLSIVAILTPYSFFAQQTTFDYEIGAGFSIFQNSRLSNPIMLGPSIFASIWTPVNGKLNLGAEISSNLSYGKNSYEESTEIDPPPFNSNKAIIRSNENTLSLKISYEIHSKLQATINLDIANYNPTSFKYYLNEVFIAESYQSQINYLQKIDLGLKFRVRQFNLSFSGSIRTRDSNLWRTGYLGAQLRLSYHFLSLP
ncbi:hypothetical protein [Croceimicrobium sp.]|uniref:hypothetical protein n=1 Tax=Croceimicrobium sp. TaxID=2828340 RepID=UPI003BA8E6FD